MLLTNTSTDVNVCEDSPGEAALIPAAFSRNPVCLQTLFKGCLRCLHNGEVISGGLKQRTYVTVQRLRCCFDTDKRDKDVTSRGFDKFPAAAKPIPPTVSPALLWSTRIMELFYNIVNWYMYTEYNSYRKLTICISQSSCSHWDGITVMTLRNPSTPSLGHWMFHPPPCAFFTSGRGTR